MFPPALPFLFGFEAGLREVGEDARGAVGPPGPRGPGPRARAGAPAHNPFATPPAVAPRRRPNLAAPPLAPPPPVELHEPGRGAIGVQDVDLVERVAEDGSEFVVR